ncbi:DDT domain-containing protein DDR4 isoform X2 [Cornus florida]|uniref:DDT domain-containing protein DDR4 isoform X2 n=1 Tax=Cornus florida TaxID=4283 RepID=UPI0028970D1B|nr:DDT domain-containing protein DDR4 isoform X2 [Cornus florida]
MQTHDLPFEPSVDNPHPPDLSTMSHEPSSPIHNNNNSSPNEQPQHSQNNHNTHNNNENKNTHNNNNNNNNIVKRERPSRACTVRSAARLYAAAAAEAAVVSAGRRQKAAKKERLRPREVEEERSPSPQQQQCSKIVTPLANPPPPGQLPRWSIRSMWELASILNFLNVFRPFLNIKVEFSVEELETALITPNNTLGDIHIPLLKAIPPITRMALGHNTWVTVLCRKLRDWWHWVADGELPIVASHGAEIEAYNTLDPGVRVVILKALCDIRVEQEDIRNYIDDSVKHGVHLSAFRKERIGGDSYGISYWFEDDPIIGHRLYREIRKVEVKKGKGKSVQPIPNSCYQWETVATNLDEFEDVSEKLFSSKNRTEASLGKKLKIDMLPEIEKVHKRKEKLLKKQHRQALLLDNMINVDGLATGRSLRDRKPVTYTFDDYDRSINEAIKITKKQPSPEPTVKREFVVKPDASTNGRWSGSSQFPEDLSFEALSPKSPDYDETSEDHKSEPLDRSNRRRQRPQRYSAREFVEAISDNEADFDSDDDIVGEAVYDEEYLRRRKQRKLSSSSEGDEEYHWDDENAEDDEEEEEDEEDSLTASENSDEPKRPKKLSGRTRRETKLRSVGELQSGLRRSNRATRNRINYRQYEVSESDTESMKPEKSNATDEHSNASNSAQFLAESEDSEGNIDNEEIKIDQPVEEHPETVEERQNPPPEKSNSPSQDEVQGVRKRRFLDLNELAPGSGFEDGPNTTMQDEDTDDF